MKKTIIIIILVTLGVYSYSQSIKNTQFKQVVNTIVVDYEISLPESRIANVELYVSTDGGRNFKGPLKAVTGDIGEINTSGSKSIVWNVFDEFDKLEGDVSFEVRARLQSLPFEKQSFAAYNISGTSIIGFTYGQVEKTGWYARIKTNGIFASADYELDYNYGLDVGYRITNYDGEGYYTFTNKVKRSRIGITGGFVYRIKPNIYLYTGGGFGYRAVLWNANEYSVPGNQIIGDIWAKNTRHSALGAEIELGAMYRIKKFNVSLGINTINFTFAELHLGVGMFF